MIWRGQVKLSALEVTLDPVPASVPAARRWVRDQLALLPQYPIDAVLLCLSEIATNALLHGRTSITVRLDQDGKRLRIEVTDTGDVRMNRPVYAEDWNAESGRGLQLVSVLSNAYGIDVNRNGPGVTAWFEVVADESAGAENCDDATA